MAKEIIYLARHKAKEATDVAKEAYSRGKKKNTPQTAESSLERLD